jgi:hypothetical protein
MASQRTALHTQIARGILAAGIAVLLLPARAGDLVEFSSQGLPRSEGLVVRLQHPPAWKKVDSDDPLALAELRGPQDGLTAILQVARGARRKDMEAVCRPERATEMLRTLAAEEADTRVTDVFARQYAGRPAYEIRYERGTTPDLLRVRSLIVCLKDTRLVVSCGAMGASKAALDGIEPACSRMFESLSITEE